MGESRAAHRRGHRFRAAVGRGDRGVDGPRDAAAQEWLAGPSEAEKQDWAGRQSGGFLDDLLSLPGMLEPTDLPEAAQRFLREAELAGKGTVYALSRAPLKLWSYLIRAGRAFEDDSAQQPRRRRVRY